MQFIQHPQCNGVLNPAEGDEDKVDSLPVARGRMGVAGVVRSYWVPTQEEIEMLRAGPCCIAFTIFGTTHAPIRLDVEALPEPENIPNLVLVPANGLPN